MNILILGCSTIGSTLARQLSQEQYDVTVVDNQKQKLTKLQEKYDIRTVLGQPSYPETLKEANAENADIIIAVSDKDEINMIACQIAHTLFKVKKKIARISSPHYLVRNELFGDKDLPIDIFINTERLVMNLIRECIDHPGSQQVLRFQNPQLVIASVKIQEESEASSLMSQQLISYFPSETAAIIALFRQGTQQTLTDDFVLHKNDTVYFICEHTQLDSMLKVFYPQALASHSVIIGGGGQNGSLLAKNLSSDFRVKLIENNRQRCFQLAHQFPDLTILHGDATDKDLLVNENIENTDLFCAMTHDDEDNLISSLQAKHLGAKNVITLVNRLDYLDIFTNNDLDVLIVPHQVVINDIFTHIHRGNFLSVHALAKGNMEVIEVSLVPDCFFLEKPYLPSEIKLCGIIRDNKPLVIEELDQYQTHDILILLVENASAVMKLENLFT
ncbi:MAG TPA: Trk system potassium transporter TrkA [Gammaproteobacteria bacterium]|nr:Trk system potassium transporter TrkA [Gammaproteobacteria bacterium]